jgi:uncharacterized membrane protein YkvA (DUF1232 family)
MPSVVSRAMQVVIEVPKHGKLAYCLLRDERVPRAPKAVLLAAMALIVSPIDLPAWVPLVGELDMLALAILAVQTFIEACPEEIRREHQAALSAGTSTFDHDFGDTLAILRAGTARAIRRLRARFQRRLPQSTTVVSSVAEGY